MFRRAVRIFLILALFSHSLAILNAQEASPRQIIFLSLDDVTELALENSLDIQIAKFDAYTKRNDLLEAVSIYDTILSANFSYKNSQLKQSSTILGTKSVTNTYGLGVSKELPSGTVLELDFEDSRDFSNSTFATLNPSHEATAKFTLKQPLGRNFFGLIDRSNIKITKLDIENSDWSSLSRIEATLAEVQSAYWKVVLLFEEMEIKRGMLKKAENLYAIYKGKRRIGLIEDPDLLAAEANMILRQNEVLGAINSYNTARNNLLLLLNEDSRDIWVTPIDRLALEGESVDFDSSLNAAIENRKDYKTARNNVLMKKTSVVMKKNNLWPEIDLEASFARNGLLRHFGEAWRQVYKEDNPEIFVGVTIEFPLENRKATGEYNKAQLEQAKSLLELKKTERKILTEINDLVTRINILIGKVITNRRVAVLQEKKLEAEDKRFKYGRSSSDIMIRYQEDLLNAKLSLVKSLYDYNNALIELKIAQNTLLDEYWKEEEVL